MTNRKGKQQARRTRQRASSIESGSDPDRIPQALSTYYESKSVEVVDHAPAGCMRCLRAGRPARPIRTVGKRRQVRWHVCPRCGHRFVSHESAPQPAA